MPYDYEDVGFTPEIVAASARSARALSAWGDLAHTSLSDPSGAAVRYTYDPAGGPVCEEPLLLAGTTTQVHVTHADVDADCVWCSVVQGDVRDDDGRTRTRLAFTVPDLANTIGAWHHDAPTPVRLSVWPHQLATYSSDERYLAAQEKAGGPPMAIGSWIPTGLFGTEATPFGSCTGRVADLAVHVNQHTGALFGLAHVPVPGLGLSVVVPLTGDELSMTRLEPGHVVQVVGQVRASYAGPPGRAVTRGRAAPWLAQVLGLAPAPAAGALLDAPPPGPPPPPVVDELLASPLPPPAPAAPSGAGPDVVEVVRDVLAAVSCAPGTAVAVQFSPSGTHVLGASSAGTEWRLALRGSFESLTAHDDHALVVTSVEALVVDAYGVVGTRLARPQGEVRWAVSAGALWALVRTGVEGQAPGWVLHRLARRDWSADLLQPGPEDRVERWSLPPASGATLGHWASLSLGDSRGIAAVAVLPDDGSGGGPVLAKVPSSGDALVYRPTPDQLPIAVVQAPAGELVTTADGTWFAGQAVAGLVGATAAATTWHPLSSSLLAGVVVRPDWTATTGVLQVDRAGGRWHEVGRVSRFGTDTRFAVDEDLEEDQVWSSVRGPHGTRVSLLDLRSGAVVHDDVPGEVSLVAGSSQAGSVLLLEEQPEQRVYAPGGQHAVTGRPPGRLVRRRTGIGR